MDDKAKKCSTVEQFNKCPPWESIVLSIDSLVWEPSRNIQKTLEELLKKIKFQKKNLQCEKRHQFLAQTYKKDFEYAESIELPAGEFSNLSSLCSSDSQAKNLSSASVAASSWKFFKANEVHSQEEIEILEDVSNQLKTILAKFHKIHMNKRKLSLKTETEGKSQNTATQKFKKVAQHKKVETKEDLSDQIMQKFRF